MVEFLAGIIGALAAGAAAVIPAAEAAVVRETRPPRLRLRLRAKNVASWQNF
jgi:hypothetical protein